MNSINSIIVGSEKFKIFHSKSDSNFGGFFSGVCINSQYGRFGNNIKQLKNAIRMADILGVNSIAVTNSVFIEWFPRFAFENINGYNFIIVEDLDDLSEGGWLCSDFFDISNFNSYLKSFDEVGFSSIVKKIFDFDCPRKLSVHVRSGDIFVENPHPSYIQPSFEYYRVAVEDYFTSNFVDHISLVCEDMKNPVIHKLIDYFSSSGRRFVVNSADFLSGFNELRGSDCVVFGFGSFSQPILYTSLSVKCVYFPSYETEGLRLSKSLGIFAKFINLEDYINVGDWINSAEQRAFMLTHDKCSNPVVF